MKKNYFKLLVCILLLITGTFRSYSQCTFTGLNANYCTNSPSTALTPGIPGGAFTGPGILPSGSAFSPALAGPGTHTITYNICSSTYSITLGTFAPQTTVGTAVSLTDDATSGTLPIGFAFNFFCTSYTDFYICSNGFITFTGGQASPFTTATIPVAAPANMIAFPWCDLNPTLGGTITYTTVGTAPTRTLLVSFNAVAHHNGLLGGNPVTVQTKLMEGTNLIEIHTTTMPINILNGTGPTNHVMGINLNATVAYPVAGRNATNNWSATNECYRWTPGASCTVSQTTAVSPSTISVAGNNSICIGSTSTLTAGGNSTYTWNTTSNSSVVAVSPTLTTTYTVSGTNSFGCIASSPITVTVDVTPTVTAINSSPAGGVCPGKTLTLNGAGASSYTWTGGSPTVTNGIAFVPSGSGTYTVHGNNACGTNSTSISVSIHPLPTVIAVASTPSLCSGSSLTLTTTGSNASTYTWTGGFISGTSFTPAATAIYTVTGTSALTCTALATVPVTVVNTPTAFPTANPPLVCLGNSSTLIATTASNYTWSSASQTVFTNSLVVTPTSSGVTTYTVRKANGVCVDVKTVSVTTNPLPTVLALVNPTIVCSMSPATLAVAGGQTYTWTASAPANFTFTGASPVVYPAVNTTYTVAANDGTCVNTAVISLATNPVPNITITPVPASGSICVGQQISLTASGGLNYTWTTANTTSVSANITESPTIATVYNIVANNIHNCTSTSQQVVLVHPNPTITVNVLKPLVCSGGLSTLTAQGANTFTWDANANGALTASAVVTSTNSTSGPVIYTVAGSYTNTGCSSTKTVQVSVFVPSLTVTGNTNTCFGGNVTLVASGGTNSYNWNTGTGTPYTFPSITTTVTAPAIFTVSAITSSTGVNCPSSATIGVGVYYNPTITASPQRTSVCKGESVDLYADGGVSYVWSNSVPGGTITVVPTANTTYSVIGTDANGCSSTGTVTIKYSSCTGINELNASNEGVMVYPNPNNGQFIIQSSSDLKLTITNELGQAVHFLQLSGANDHKISVSDLAQGIYFVTGEGVNQKIVVTK